MGSKDRLFVAIQASQAVRVSLVYLIGPKIFLKQPTGSLIPAAAQVRPCCWKRGPFDLTVVIASYRSVISSLNPYRVVFTMVGILASYLILEAIAATALTF
jgi:hypothetical protein